MLVERWDGKHWTIQPIPTPRGGRDAELADVSCASGTACIAVGSFVNASYRRLPLVQRWNGKRWSIEQIPSPAGATYVQLIGVSCASSSVCTVVGMFVNHAGHSALFAERWKGSRVTIQPVPNPRRATYVGLSDVSCTKGPFCIAVGRYSTSRNYDPRSGPVTALAERWDGKRWSVQRVPNPPGTVDSGLWDVSCASTSACTAVGDDFGRNLNGALAERWNGKHWTVQTTAPAGSTTARLIGVSCATRTACTAVGELYNSSSLLIERWSGTK